IPDLHVTGVQTCALPISGNWPRGYILGDRHGPGRLQRTGGGTLSRCRGSHPERRRRPLLSLLRSADTLFSRTAWPVSLAASIDGGCEVHCVLPRFDYDGHASTRSNMRTVT